MEVLGKVVWGLVLLLCVALGLWIYYLGATGDRLQQGIAVGTLVLALGVYPLNKLRQS